jgi:hypothetical protein
MLLFGFLEIQSSHVPLRACFGLVRTTPFFVKNNGWIKTLLARDWQRQYGLLTYSALLPPSKSTSTPAA